MGLKRLIIVVEILIIVMLLYVVMPKVGAEVKGKYFLLTATGYYPGIECCYPFHDGLTATGAKAGRGCIAIDNKAGILKMGQKIFVEGYGYGVCNDVGSAIKGWKIDLCFDTLQEAKEWGRKLVKVYLVEG